MYFYLVTLDPQGIKYPFLIYSIIVSLNQWSTTSQIKQLLVIKRRSNPNNLILSNQNAVFKHLPLTGSYYAIKRSSINLIASGWKGIQWGQFSIRRDAGFVFTLLICAFYTAWTNPNESICNSKPVAFDWVSNGHRAIIRFCLCDLNQNKRQMKQSDRSAIKIVGLFYNKSACQIITPILHSIGNI
jgi:hypothetical protein